MTQKREKPYNKPSAHQPQPLSTAEQVRVPNKAPARNWLAWAIATATAVAGGSPVAAVAAANAQAAASSPVQPWVTYVQKLKADAQSTAAVQSALAGVKAGHGAVSAQTGDRGLNLDANYTDFPGGGGSTTSTTGSSINLEQYAEVRASWGLLDFFGRRPGRIASAEAKVNAAQADVKYARQNRQQYLVSQSVAVWAARHERQALENALSDLKNANEAMDKLQNHSLSPNLSEAVTQASNRALKLQAQIEQQLAGLPEGGQSLPLPPDSYWTLPKQPPSDGMLKQVAETTPLAAKLRAQAKSFDAQTRAYWAENYHFKIYGGYVQQKVHNQSGYQHGPEVGASLTIPIGGGGGGDRANAHWQARQKDLAAKAAVQQQQQLLQQLRLQWVQAAANLRSQVNVVRHQAQQVNIMRQRYVTGAGAKTPEPWQLQIEGAEFWSSVANTWEARGQWIQAVLSWSVYDQGYLTGHAQSGAGAPPKGLCSPLPQCPRA